MKLGIISDTHNILREEVMERLKTCDYILHAGDFCKQEVFEELQEVGKLYAVRGNNDKEIWAREIPVNVVINLEGYKIGMAHEKKDLPECEVDLMIYGHSHKYEAYMQDKVQYLNPGSCGRKRFNLPLSFVIAEVKGNTICLEKIDL